MKKLPARDKKRIDALLAIGRDTRRLRQRVNVMCLRSDSVPVRRRLEAIWHVLNSAETLVGTLAQDLDPPRREILMGLPRL